MLEEIFKFKFATEEWEFEQIHRLNYQSFVEEIPQHAANPTRKLVDKYHSENLYLIALRGREVVAMIAFRDKRPFSLDAKISDLDSYLPVDKRHVVEVRLLAVKEQCRNSRVSHELLMKTIAYCTRHYDITVVSATLRQQRLYQHIGFVPFGPMVGSELASYQPMYVTSDEALRRFPQLEVVDLRLYDDENQPVLLQPGPVTINPLVRTALMAPSVSHRSQRFRQLFNECRDNLCDLVNAENVVVAMGSGTLANDMVAGQLAQLNGRGLIISNGEFGERLIDHATRMQLNFDTLQIPWGQSFTQAMLEQQLSTQQDYQWLWATHCETSTGVLNDLAMLKAVSASHNIVLALDSISSVGLVPVDLTGVYLASCVSGKGLCSYAGLAMVFHQQLPAITRVLPRYLDLQAYVKHDGIPYTLSSHLVRALNQALSTENYSTRFRRLNKFSSWLVTCLSEIGVNLISPGALRNPAVLTFSIPELGNSQEVGDALAEAGYLLSYQSGYLKEKNWLQICLFGGYFEKAMFNKLLTIMKHKLSVTTEQTDSLSA